MLVNRDPFARTELHREPIKGECDNCGLSNRHGKVWKYRIETDGGRRFDIKGNFRSNRCRREYHGN